ncbi:hypothetical protein QFC21_001120 [Naganishia friedmannii]|uniref:Uncharacterized protein n=1 Tax=Naganishia friedmannii TaxID=89922 RepID=A0ACC2W8M9_9TREE|nr:hypothetical protein QFC21_001120 [Naganishia friedmannii]
MHNALGLTGVPLLTFTGKPLHYEDDLEMGFNFPPPPSYTKNQVPYALHTLPLTPDASPIEWERSGPGRPATPPPGDASPLHPPGAPLYGLGFHPSCFEEDLPRITISAPHQLPYDVDEGIPTPHTTPLLVQPPFHKTRLQRSIISLPYSPILSGLFSPSTKTARYSLRRRRRSRKLYQRMIWAACAILLLFTLQQKVARTAWFSSWMKRNSQWSASVHTTEDTIYGLEEDYTPQYFHRTQRHQYFRHITQLPPLVAEADEDDIPFIIVGDEVEHHAFDEKTLTENQESFFADSATNANQLAISDQIDNIFSSPEIESYISSMGVDSISAYHEAISVMAAADIDIILDQSRDNVLSTLRRVDDNRRSFLKAMMRFLTEGGHLPQEWKSETSFEAVLRDVWTATPNNRDFPALFTTARELSDTIRPVFAEDWESEISSKADVTVFIKLLCFVAVKGTSTRSQRLRKILSAHRTVVQPYYIDLDQRPDGEIIASLLHRLTGIETLPNVMVGFESIGGWHQVLILQSEGKLKERLVARI